MGAACSVGGKASVQEPLKAGPRFMLPSGPTVANPPRRIADASDAGVTLGFLQQFFKQVCGHAAPLASTPCRCARRSLPRVSREPLGPNPNRFGISPSTPPACAAYGPTHSRHVAS
jgi:hypothetical protein